MIQVYKADNENYENHGDMTLLPIDCTVDAVLMDAWNLELSHPLDAEGRWKYLEDGNVIKAPSFNGDQLFRIYNTVKTDSGVTVKAEPIAMDMVGDLFLMDTRAVGKTGQEALDIIFDGTKYTGVSDIQNTSTAYFVLMNGMEAICGESDNSFINRWGGEPYFDNFTLYMNKRAGSDRGVQVLYGKNIPTDGISETIDVTDVVTRIIPQAFNGRLITGTSYVDSPLIDAYPTIKTKLIEYQDIVLASDDEGGDTEGKIICETQEELNQALIDRANEEFENGIDKPRVTIAIDLVLLENTEEYKEFKGLETIRLGDTIHCNHSRLGITTDARVVGITYDCIRKMTTAVTIGDVEANIMDRISSVVTASEKAIKKDGTVLAEQIEGIVNSMKAQLRLQNTVAERQDVRAILFEDLDPNSSLYGAMSLGTQGFQIANERLPDDSDWKWTTFGTAQGFSADLIVAGILNAITITGSTLLSEWSNGEVGLKIQGGRLYLYSSDGTRRGFLTGASNSSSPNNIGLIAEYGSSAFLGVKDETTETMWPYVVANGSSNRVSLSTKNPAGNGTLSRFVGAETGITYMYGVYQNVAYPQVVCNGASRGVQLLTPDGNGSNQTHVWGDGVNNRTYVYEPVLSGNVRVSDGSTISTGYTGSVASNRGLTVKNGLIVGIT